MVIGTVEKTQNSLELTAVQGTEVMKYTLATAVEEHYIHLSSAKRSIQLRIIRAYFVVSHAVPRTISRR